MTPREEHRSLPTREEAIARAQAIIASAWAATAQLYAEEGALAVGRAAAEPGGPPAEAIAAMYEGWVQEERAKRDAARQAGAA